MADLVEGLKKANYWWVLLSMVIGMGANVIRGLRWRMLIEPLGYHPSRMVTFHAVMVGYLVNFALPRAGEFSRCAVLNRTNKIPFNTLLGTVVTERIVDLVCLIIAITLVFFIRIDFFGTFLSDTVFIPLLNKISALFSMSVWVWLLVLFLIAAAIAGILAFKRHLKRNKIVRKVWTLGKGVMDGLKAIFKMKQWPVFVLYSILIWVCYWMTSYMTMLSIPITASLTPADAMFLMILGGLGWIVPVQGGFGAFHFIVSLGLTIYGIPREEGVVFATISHESQAISMIVFGFISLIAIFMINRRQTKLQTSS